jgi:hypothetical protein
VSCNFDSLNLLAVADGGSNLLHWWRRRELNPIRSLRGSAWTSLIQHQLGSISLPLNPARSI